MTSPNAAGDILYTTDGSDPRETRGDHLHRPRADQRQQHCESASASGQRMERAETRPCSACRGGVSALRITEIHYHPGEVSSLEEAAGFDDEDSFEFIELQNTGTVPVELAGVTFSEAIEFTFPAGDTRPWRLRHRGR